MSAEDLSLLPLPHRLALSYAPVRSRDALLTLMLLDNRLAGVLRQRGENALIAQMKLAWWRDRLGQDPQLWPSGEPLLRRLHDWPGTVNGLVALVDGWEELLREDLTPLAVASFAKRRAAGFSLLAEAMALSSDKPAIEQAAREWALFDLAGHLNEGSDRDLVMQAMRSAAWEKPQLPREFRPVAVLHGLARRAMDRGHSGLLDRPGALLTALQLGLLGR